MEVILFHKSSFSHDASSNVMQLLSLEEPWTLIIDDALANSFVAPTTDDIKDDHQLTCKFSSCQSEASFILKCTSFLMKRLIIFKPLRYLGVGKAVLQIRNYFILFVYFRFCTTVQTKAIRRWLLHSWYSDCKNFIQKIWNINKKGQALWRVRMLLHSC